METVDKKIALGSWVSTSEPTEWIAARTDQLLQGLTKSVGASGWELSLPSGASEDPDAPIRRVPWEGDKRALVAKCPVSASFRSASLDEGYALHLYGQTPDECSVKVRVRAGDSSLGKRTPGHTVHVEFVAPARFAIPDDVAGTLVHSIVVAFDPQTASQVDVGIVELARRGGWKVVPSYRLWLRHDVLVDAALPAGMTSERVGEGWLYTVPDDVAREQVVALHEEFRVLNGLDTLPH
ncbi:hypothetical protein QFZ53_001701 [Microbacterium natoriense]|uniref:Uncharacterized protein n=1 Tax=Microbacterium natoriense TaxID=284570 RepID=A0AAW8EVM6_9MICO|nr:hypothetical protein [Microbacterium natoriense]MDQ0647505.1 hypothetical protein [Microbacterium natoriense]